MVIVPSLLVALIRQKRRERSFSSYNYNQYVKDQPSDRPSDHRGFVSHFSRSFFFNKKWKQIEQKTLAKLRNWSNNALIFQSDSILKDTFRFTTTYTIWKPPSLVFHHISCKMSEPMTNSLTQLNDKRSKAVWRTSRTSFLSAYKVGLRWWFHTVVVFGQQDRVLT